MEILCDIPESKMSVRFLGGVFIKKMNLPPEELRKIGKYAQKSYSLFQFPRFW